VETSSLNISQCSSSCPNCKVQTDFLMFESGAGGDFKTYIGETTGTIYRLDMNKIHYLNFELSDLLSATDKLENEIRSIPEQVKCKVCNSTFKADVISTSGYLEVKAVQL